MVKFCGQCGKELEEGCKFCGNCGAPVEQDIYEENQHDTSKTDTSDEKQEAQNNDNGADLKNSITEQKDKAVKLIKNCNKDTAVKYVIGVLAFVVLCLFISTGVFNHADYKVSPIQLAREGFGTDETHDEIMQHLNMVKTKYKGKTVEMTGKALRVDSYNDSPQMAVMMYRKDIGQDRNAKILFEIDNEAAKKIETGKIITVMGKFKGISWSHQDNLYRIVFKDGKLIK